LNLGLGYFAPRSTQPSIPPGLLIPIVDERVSVQVKLKSLENTCHT